LSEELKNLTHAICAVMERMWRKKKIHMNVDVWKMELHVPGIRWGQLAETAATMPLVTMVIHAAGNVMKLEQSAMLKTDTTHVFCAAGMKADPGLFITIGLEIIMNADA
jgi:hypothetical protein